MKEKVAVLIQKQVAVFELQPVVYESEINYLLKRSRKVFIMSCVIVSRS
jgi:hypothetical protein